MKLKTLAAAAALMAASSAFAVEPGDLGNIDNQSFAIGASHSGNFFDFYQFDVSASGVAVGGLISGTADVQIFGIGFFDAFDNVIASDTDGSDGFASLATLAAAGTYRFAVVGQADGGSYSGWLETVIPNPVPEPETYALMLAGLGVLAWVSKRRKAA